MLRHSGVNIHCPHPCGQWTNGHAYCWIERVLSGARSTSNESCETVWQWTWIDKVGVGWLRYVTLLVIICITMALDAQGNVTWQVHSLFSGIECFREAILVLESAIAERFSIKLNVGYEIMVAHKQLLQVFYCNEFLPRQPQPESGPVMAHGACFLLHWGRKEQRLQEAFAWTLAQHLPRIRYVWSAEDHPCVGQGQGVVTTKAEAGKGFQLLRPQQKVPWNKFHCGLMCPRMWFLVSKWGHWHAMFHFHDQIEVQSFLLRWLCGCPWGSMHLPLEDSQLNQQEATLVI